MFLAPLPSWFSRFLRGINVFELWQCDCSNIKHGGVQHAISCKNAARAISRTSVRHDAVRAHTCYLAVAPQRISFSTIFSNCQHEVRTIPITKSRLDIAGNPNSISGLAISPFVEDLSFLEQKFQDAGWRLYTAHTCREALVQLTHERMPIVICERQLPDGSWKDVLSQLAPMVDRPRLIVVSRDADERLWEEVLNMGAFDLLSTPFREAELAFTIGSAWLDWTGQHERHRSRSLRRSSTA